MHYVQSLNHNCSVDQCVQCIWIFHCPLFLLYKCLRLKWLSYFCHQVCGIVIAYLIAVVKLWSPENKHMLSYLSIPIWLLVLFCIIANAGPFRLPLAMAIICLMGVGLYTDSVNSQPRDPSSHESSGNLCSKCKYMYLVCLLSQTHRPSRANLRIRYYCWFLKARKVVLVLSTRRYLNLSCIANQDKFEIVACETVCKQ